MAAKKKFELDAIVRHDTGKGASRRLRRDAKVPGVIYGGGKDAVSLTFEHKHVTKALENEAFYSQIITLKLADGAEKVILKDLQRHPYKPRIQHIDFQRIRADEKLHMHVPLHFLGGDKAPGVKEAGGVVSHLMTDVEIACLPDDLPEYLELDISGMKLNDALHLSDIKLPKGVEVVALTHQHDQAVVSVYMPREEAIPEEAPVVTEVPTEQKSPNEGEETK